MAICNNKKCSIGECNQSETCAAYVPVITNAQKIRSMSDDELLVFLDEFSSRCIECVEDAKNQSCPIYKEGYYCRPQDIMGWLKQPAEEDNND